ncbi:hypothetical protein FS837_004627 [Tulasnella sp. UAMH 9824]|nr:hypothetical protein FS837_004627 [Tulasnella sp. UAMH 9824]
MPQSMTDESSRPVPPPPETVDQALTILLKAMGQGEPAGKDGQDNMEPGANHLDRLAWRYQVAGEALQLVAQTRAALLRRQRNDLLPINRLPSELLSRVLLKSFDNNQRPRLWALQELAQVTWRWWQIIKSDPQFWTYICPPLESVELHIRKAGVLPLDLDWGVSMGSTDQEELKCLLQAHAERWASIEFEAYREGVALQVLCTKRFPRLKYLKVRQTDVTMEGDWKLNVADCQNLEEAHLPLMPYFSPSPSSSPPTHLRVLHLDLSSMDAYSSLDLEPLLQVTPQLVELELKNLYVDPSPPPTSDAPIINIQTLRSLRFINVALGRSREGIPLIARIRAPRLDNLGLRYDFDSEGRPVNIFARTIFDELLTRPGASSIQSKDAPLFSILRNILPSSFWTLRLTQHYVNIAFEGSGPGRLNMSFYTSNAKEDLIRHILVHLTPFAFPIDIDITWRESSAEELEFWGIALDAMPTLRSFTLNAPLQVAQQIMNRLSTKAPSSAYLGPRAPSLEKLRFRSNGKFVTPWSEGDEGDDVKTMLGKRHDFFTEVGVLSPPKMTVEGPQGFTFDQVESNWFAT